MDQRPRKWVARCSQEAERSHCNSEEEEEDFPQWNSNYSITDGAGESELCRESQRVGIRGVGDVTQISELLQKRKSKQCQRPRAKAARKCNFLSNRNPEIFLISFYEMHFSFICYNTFRCVFSSAGDSWKSFLLYFHTKAGFTCRNISVRIWCALFLCTINAYKVWLFVSEFLFRLSHIVCHTISSTGDIDWGDLFCISYKHFLSTMLMIKLKHWLGRSEHGCIDISHLQCWLKVTCCKITAIKK